MLSVRVEYKLKTTEKLLCGFWGNLKNETSGGNYVVVT